MQSQLQDLPTNKYKIIAFIKLKGIGYELEITKYKFLKLLYCQYFLEAQLPNGN